MAMGFPANMGFLEFLEEYADLLSEKPEYEMLARNKWAHEQYGKCYFCYGEATYGYQVKEGLPENCKLKIKMHLLKR